MLLRMKTISITMDVEPDFGGRLGLQWEALNEVLPEVLDLFNEYGVKATFFVEAETMKRNKIIRDLIHKDYEIASHGYMHQKLTQWTIPGQFKEIKQAFDDFGIAPTGFRSPYLIPPDYWIAVLNIANEAYDLDFEYDSSLCSAAFPFRYNYLDVPNHKYYPNPTKMREEIDKSPGIVEIPVSRIPRSISAFSVMQSSFRLPSKKAWSKTENAVCFFHSHDLKAWDKETLAKLPWYMRFMYTKRSGNNINVLRRIIETFSDREFVKMEELTC